MKKIRNEPSKVLMLTENVIGELHPCAKHSRSMTYKKQQNKQMKEKLNKVMLEESRRFEIIFTRNKIISKNYLK